MRIGGFMRADIERKAEFRCVEKKVADKRVLKLCLEKSEVLCLIS